MDAGYPYVFSNRTNYKSPFSRRIYVACIDEEWKRKFDRNERTTYLDKTLLEQGNQETRRDRKSDVKGKRASVRVDIGGSRIRKKKHRTTVPFTNNKRRRAN